MKQCLALGGKAEGVSRHVLIACVIAVGVLSGARRGGGKGASAAPTNATKMLVMGMICALLPLSLVTTLLVQCLFL
jgi:hypothetical protein